MSELVSDGIATVTAAAVAVDGFNWINYEEAHKAEQLLEIYSTKDSIPSSESGSQVTKGGRKCVVCLCATQLSCASVPGIFPVQSNISRTSCRILLTTLITNCAKSHRKSGAIYICSQSASGWMSAECRCCRAS